MAQETLYFQHDYNPFEDIRFEALVANHGVIGYGIFWRLIEMLHTSADHLLAFDDCVYESVSGKLSVPTNQVKIIIEDCIKKYHLFQSNGEVFWSERVFRNIEKRKQISKQRSLAGKASAEQRRKDREIADGEQPLNNR